MVKLEKVGFISALIGGLLGLVSGILGLVNVTLFAPWYLGGVGLLGWLINPTAIVWVIIFLVLCALALAIGVVKSFTELLELDLLIWGIILIVLGALIWGIPGWLVLVGGILVILGKFME